MMLPAWRNDLSFPPPLIEQAKYLALADQYLGFDKTQPHEGKAMLIDSSRHLGKSGTKDAA